MEDNAKYKWISTKGNSDTTKEVSVFLEELKGSMRLLHCTYEEENLKVLSLLNKKTIVASQEWETNVKTSPVKGRKNALDLEVVFKLKKGEALQTGVAVAFDFLNWDSENYVLLPASVYNGNRVKIVDRGYNEGLDRSYLYQKDTELMSASIPQLTQDKGTKSLLELNSSNLATPAMCFINKKTQKAFIVLSNQKSQYGDHGFNIEESLDKKRASFVISVPAVREKKPAFVGFTKSDDRGVTINQGTEIKLNLRVFSLDIASIPELLETFMTVRKDVTGVNNPRNLYPQSEVLKLMTQRIDERYYDKGDYDFYCPENANWISFGWIGGLINTFPMLAKNDEMHLQRVKKTFDFAISNGQGASGYFYGALNFDGKIFGREGYDEFPEIVLTRKNADVLFWMCKQFMLLDAQGNGNSINPIWEKSIKRLADAFVKTWKENKQWGNFINNKTGEIAVYNTSSGVMAIGGLALASEYFEMPEYLEIAEQAAEFYYQNDFVNQGQTTGCCADILQNSDSETAASFMASLMVLYETTGDKKWLDQSKELANLLATWTTSYDYELPKDTELGKLDAKLAGIVWASTQNKHGAPGICTSSGDPLFKIYRATGSVLYADLMSDIMKAYGESIRPGGYTNERLTYCDADSRGERGNHVTGWTELNGALMALEIPGIYVQTDADIFYVFDHIKAKVVTRGHKGITLQLFNDTPYDASVSVLAETRQQSKKALGTSSFLKWEKVEVKSKETKIISINLQGEIVNNS